MLKHLKLKLKLIFLAVFQKTLTCQPYTCTIYSIDSQITAIIENMGFQRYSEDCKNY